ncbi:sigma-70 family RNA polymerase sigma factor [Kitasatospora sp. NPDC087314]|uniref:sigma-70 family RNA polymerase sigma factor n=1 Tax=Kitasatospora sp. NPDC087314 TaxID=3364068 RepID=UPI00381D1DC5
MPWTRCATRTPTRPAAPCSTASAPATPASTSPTSAPPYAPLLARLPSREQAVLKLRFWDVWTQSEIAERIGVSQVHVSRLLTATLTRLREQLEDRDAPGWADDPQDPD